MVNIIYISSLSSKRLIDEIKENTGRDPGYAVQKFNRMLVKGLIDNQINVTILSAPPIGRHNSSKTIWSRKTETEDNITYHYLSFINLPGIRQCCLVINTFIKTLLWTKKNHNCAVVCDVLNASMNMAVLSACRITKAQTVGIMTDMPGLMVSFDSIEKLPLRTQIATTLIKWSLKHFNKFVFLTEAMNVVNEDNRPYIVMEGMSDSAMASNERVFNDKAIRTIIYAGGLHERYGLKKLVESFMKLPYDNIRLQIFGNGPFETELKEIYCKQDNRIQYMGVVSNDEVIRAERDATLLVNPRPTSEEFTKYSFPSKNIEYMSSGTPLLTTRLPGMPKEYYPYVFLIDNESIDGYALALQDTLNHSDKELYEFGSKAKSFVLKRKNNVEQARRVIELIKL